eukprot:8603947-Pyramimonas_sp.AAC.1
MQSIWLCPCNRYHEDCTESDALLLLPWLGPRPRLHTGFAACLRVRTRTCPCYIGRGRRVEL